MALTNNLYLKASGPDSIYFLSGTENTPTTSNQTGRLFGTPDNMYFDFYNQFNFRYKSAPNDIVITTPFYITSSGINAVNITASSFNATSDYRIKKDIVELVENENVNDLHPIKYYNTLTNKTEYGFIAHEMQDIFPDLVNKDKDCCEGYQSINYIGIIAILTKEIQRLKAKIDTFLSQAT